VTSLGLVSPGAATDGVNPMSSWKKTDDLFSHRHLVRSTMSPLFFLKKLTSVFFSSLSLFYFTVSPPMSDLPCPLFCVNSATFSFGCHPLEDVTRGGPPPPPSDATGCCRVDAWWWCAWCGCCGYWAPFIVQRLTFMMTRKRPYTEYNSKKLVARRQPSHYEHVCCSHYLHTFHY